MKDDMEHRGLAEEDALDRKEWRRRIRQPTPWSRETGGKEEEATLCRGFKSSLDMIIAL